MVSADVSFETAILGLGAVFQENPLAGGEGQSTSRKSTGLPTRF